MTGNITSEIAFAAIVGAAMGLFYTVLLNTHGFVKIKYKYVALSLGTIIFLLGLYSFEAAATASFILGIGIFILAIALFVRGTADGLKDMSARFFKRKTGEDNSTTSVEKKEITSYYGAVFHLVIIVLICLSIFTTSEDVLLNEQRMAQLVRDSVFQFSSTIMLMLLGIFNPFITPSEKLLGIAKHIDRTQYPKWHTILADKRSWQLMKTLICAGIIAYFAQGGLFNLPTWNKNMPYMNAYALMIGLFIFINLMQLIRNPDVFFKRNLLRITMLFRSAYLSLFVGAILVISTMFISAILGVDADKLNVSSEAILLLGFNIVMCFNEYKVASA